MGTRRDGRDGRDGGTTARGAVARAGGDTTGGRTAAAGAVVRRGEDTVGDGGRSTAGTAGAMGNGISAGAAGGPLFPTPGVDPATRAEGGAACGACGSRVDGSGARGNTAASADGVSRAGRASSPVRERAMRSSAATVPIIVAYRSSGFSASIRWRQANTAGGCRAARAHASAGSSCAKAIPVSISKNTRPRLYWSDAARTVVSPRTCSGDRYGDGSGRTAFVSGNGLPTSVGSVDDAEGVIGVICASPKPPSFACPFAVKKITSGRTSRCTMPASCATVSPRATSAVSVTASARGSGPLFRRSFSVPSDNCSSTR